MKNLFLLIFCFLGISSLTPNSRLLLFHAQTNLPTGCLENWAVLGLYAKYSSNSFLMFWDNLSVQEEFFLES